MASLIAPLVLVLSTLIIAFSPAVLLIFLAVAALFALRLFVVFPRLACGVCAAKGRCPNARAMGIS